MKRLLLATTLACLPLAAWAVPITGDLNLAGSDSYNATSVTFIGSQDITSSTGSFAGLGTCTGCVTGTSFTYAPFVPPLAGMFHGTSGGLLFSIDLTSVHNVDFIANDSLSFEGDAVLHLTGSSDTKGEVFFSTQGPEGVEVSFSATTLPVPEPGSLVLLGAGLIGLAGWKLRR